MNILCFDVGGTFIKYALMTDDREILEKGKTPTPRTNRDDLLNVISDIFDSMERVDGIAISMTGTIDSENGYVVIGGGILTYNDDFYLRDALYSRCLVPIYIENDAKCAAVAEAAYGSLKDVSDGFVLIFGTMIGGAIIKDHKLYRGKHFSAGDVSFILTVRDGEPTDPDIWGNRCGTPFLCNLYASKKGIASSDVDGIRVFNDVLNGNKDAIECLDKYTKEIAVQIYNIQAIYDPEKISIGGGISAQPIFVEYIRKHLDKLYDRCAYKIPRANVVCAEFKNDANLYGALECFREKYLNTQNVQK